MFYLAWLSVIHSEVQLFYSFEHRTGAGFCNVIFYRVFTRDCSLLDEIFLLYNHGQFTFSIREENGYQSFLSLALEVQVTCLQTRANEVVLDVHQSHSRLQHIIITC